MHSVIRVGIRLATDQRYGRGHQARCRALAAAFPAPPVVFHDPGAPPMWQVAAVAETCVEDMAYARAALVRREIDLLVLDHYGLSNKVGELTALPGTIAVFRDNEAAGPENVSIDVSPGPERPNTLSGPEYAPLDPVYGDNVPPRRAPSRGEQLRVLVAFGAIDSMNRTGMVLDALALNASDLSITIMIGAAAPHAATVAEQAAKIGARVVVDAAEPHRQYDVHHFAIGAPGMSQFERAARGLPTILVPQDERQKQLAERWAATACTWAVAPCDEAVAEAVAKLTQDTAALESASLTGREVCDGQGALRLATALLQLVRQRGADRCA